MTPAPMDGMYPEQTALLWMADRERRLAAASRLSLGDLPQRPGTAAEPPAAAACHVPGCTTDHNAYLRENRAAQPVVRDAAWHARKERREAMNGQRERLVAVRSPADLELAWPGFQYPQETP